MARRNFARGSAPPSNSWEWVGVALPPPDLKKAPVPPSSRPPVVVATMSETIVIQRKTKKPWLWLTAAGVFGFFLGRRTKRD